MRLPRFSLAWALLGTLLGIPFLAAAEPPAVIFEDKCASCHGIDGKARTPAGRKLGAHDLSESKLGDAEIERRIREGTKDGRGKAKMPAFAETLTPDEITSLVAFVKSFRPR